MTLITINSQWVKIFIVNLCGFFFYLFKFSIQHLCYFKIGHFLKPN